MSETISKDAFESMKSKAYKKGYKQGGADKQNRIIDNINRFCMECNDDCRVCKVREVVKMIKGKTCGTCVRYADLHSSCGLVRDFRVNKDTPACDDFKGEANA